jgi:tetratricopeptide (TPR) repeat protein
MGVALDHTPLHGLAGRYLQRAIRLGEEAGQPVALGLANLQAGMHEHSLGNWDAELPVLRRSQALYWGAGDVHGWGAPSAFITGTLARQGRFAEALREGEHLAQVGELAGDKQVWGWGMLYWGESLARAGRLAEAVPVLEQAAVLSRGAADFVSFAAAVGTLGLCALHTGGWADMLPRLEEVNAEIDRHGHVAAACVPARVFLAEIYLQAAESTTGRERAEWLKKATRLCRQTLTLAKVHHLVRIGGFQEQGTLEWLAGHHRAARRWWQRSLAAAEQANAQWEIGRICAVMGRLTQDQAALRQAERVFDQIGATADLAQVRSLLPAPALAPAAPAADARL